MGVFLLAFGIDTMEIKINDTSSDESNFDHSNIHSRRLRDLQGSGLGRFDQQVQMR